MSNINPDIIELLVDMGAMFLFIAFMAGILLYVFNRVKN